MKIAVCIKQVVTREWQLRINDAKTWIRDQDASFELNEPDAYALEAALRLKEQHGGEVIAKGPLNDILKNKKSLTAKYLNGTLAIHVPKKRTAADQRRRLSRPVVKSYSTWLQ